MKKVILTTLIGSFIVLPVLTMAITAGTIPKPADYSVETTAAITPQGVLDIIISVVKWVYTAFFVIAVLVLLFAAYTYLTASGDPTKIAGVHKQLIYAAIAIAIALIAVGFVQIVKSVIT